MVDGGFATAPFLHAAGDVGWPVVAQLKDNLPELSQAAERRFRSRPPDLEFRDGTDRVQLWDADDFRSPISPRVRRHKSVNNFGLLRIARIHPM